MRANEKARHQEQREEWVERVKCFPSNDERQKHAVEPLLSLTKEKGALDYCVVDVWESDDETVHTAQCVCRVIRNAAKFLTEAGIM